MVAVVVAVEYRHHRFVGHLADHAYRHLANLQRGTRVNNNHPGRSHYKNHVGHHAAVGWRGKTIGRENHPDMRRQLFRRDVRQGRTFDKLLRLLCQQTGLGPQSGTAQCGAGQYQMSSFHSGFPMQKHSAFQHCV